MDKECLESLASKIGIQKNKIRFFFKNLKMKDYKTSRKYIKTIRRNQRFSAADIQILEEKFRSKIYLDNENLENL